MRLSKINRIVKEQTNNKILTHVSIKSNGFEDFFQFVDPPVFLHYLVTGVDNFSPLAARDVKDIFALVPGSSIFVLRS